MGTVRAGMPFSTVDNEAKREMGHGFACEPLGNRIRLCKLATDGPIGNLNILVDRSGRAALIQFLVSDTSLAWIEKARETGAEWSQIRPSRLVDPEMAASITRWETDNRRWSAQLSRQLETKRPYEMLVTDASRLARIAKANPSTLLRLASEGMLGGDDLAAAEKYASAAMAKATDSLAAAGSALARKASALPRCPPVPGAQIVEGSDIRDGMGPKLASVAEQLAARMYPGSKLVIGNRKMYLVDSQGAAEEIGLYPNAQNAENNLYAFAVTFPGRASAAFEAAKTFNTGTQCRDAGEIVLTHVDPATQSIADFKRIEVDEEALSSVIGALDFAPTTSGQPALVASYLATYGGPDWTGQIRWNAEVGLEPLRVQRRIPSSFGKNDVDGTSTGGALVVDGANKNDPYGAAVEPGAEARVSALSLRNPAAPVRHLVYLAGSNHLASGWTLISQL